jgi:hypothetical protein
VESGITTATFHILTPYPGTALHARMAADGRLVTGNWDRYDTRHVVYRPIGMSADELKTGYDWSYKAFYRWGAIVKAASQHRSVSHRLRHAAYSAGWKKFERAWDFVIRVRQLAQMRPLLERILSNAISSAPAADYGAPIAARQLVTTASAALLTVRSSSRTSPFRETSNGERATGMTGISANTRGGSFSKPDATERTPARMMLRSSSDT